MWTASGAVLAALVCRWRVVSPVGVVLLTLCLLHVCAPLLPRRPLFPRVRRYYELLDTVLLVVKKRPLSFLHVYHHCVVLILFWAYNQSRMIISWVLVVANSLVHVAMYGYFTASTFGVTVWWKKYITQAQIVQFVVDLTATWPFPLLYYGARGCSGSMRGWLFGQAVGFSFFHLFLDFYRRSYKKRGEATPPAVAAAAATPTGTPPPVAAGGDTAAAAAAAASVSKKQT